MTNCIECGSSVTRYVLKGTPAETYCVKCASITITRRNGFKSNGRFIPTVMDHANNLGTMKPHRSVVEGERRRMYLTEKAGGSLTFNVNEKHEAMKAAQRYRKRHGKPLLHKV